MPDMLNTYVVNRMSEMQSVKKLVLAITLVITPLSARWESFYARGGFSFLGTSAGGSFSFKPSFSVAGGYGDVIPNILSHGLYVGLEAEGIRKSSGYSHEAILRLGLPRAQCMFWAGPKIGYHSTNEVMFWGLRTGFDFDFILPGFFCGIAADWTIPFKEGSGSWIQCDFSVGYRY
jgi:hypothetical protein